MCSEGNVVALQQRPERTLLPSYGMPTLPRVDEADPIDNAFELHMRVAADDEALLDSLEGGSKAVVGGVARQDPSSSRGDPWQ